MGIIKTRGLVHEFIRRDEDDNVESITTALDHVDLDVKEGQFIAILGHNGSGKSTLAKHINALLRATEGTIWVEGKDVSKEENIIPVRKSAGMVFQNPDNQIIASVVEEDVAFGPENIGVPTDEIWERVEKSKNLPSYSEHLQVFFCGLGSACYTFIFGGKAFDFLFSFLIGMGEQLLLSYMAKKKLSRFLKNVFASFYVSTCSILILLTGLPVLQDKIVIGSIMALVPGITFTTSIRDFHNGDYLSGTIHLIDALLTALCVAVGICLPLAIYGYLKGVTL